MKKLLSFLCSVAVLLSLAVLPVQGAEAVPSVSLSVMTFQESTDAPTPRKLCSVRSQGDKLLIQVQLTNNTSQTIDLAAFGLKLGYDASAFTPYSYEKDGTEVASIGFGDAFSDWYGDANIGTAGEAVWTMAGETNRLLAIGDSVTLGYLLLQANNDADLGEYTFQFLVDGEGELDRNYLIDSDAQSIPDIVYAEPVGVTVVHLLGDINEDNAVNSKDALRALQHSVSQIVLSEWKQKEADVNFDGAVNSKDALKMLQYSVGQIENFD